MHILSPETDNCPSWISGRERMTVENISWSISTNECCRPRRGLHPRPPGLQSDGASNWATEAGKSIWYPQMFKLHICTLCILLFTTLFSYPAYLTKQSNNMGSANCGAYEDNNKYWSACTPAPTHHTYTRVLWQPDLSKQWKPSSKLVTVHSVSHHITFLYSDTW